MQCCASLLLSLWQIYLSVKNFLLQLFPFTSGREKPLCGSQFVPTLLWYRLIIFYRHENTFRRLYSLFTCFSLSSVLAPKGQRLRRILEPELEPPYSGQHFFWQLVSCSRLSCCHCLILCCQLAGVFLTIFMSFAQLYGKTASISHRPKWPKVSG